MRWFKITDCRWNDYIYEMTVNEMTVNEMTVDEMTRWNDCR